MSADATDHEAHASAIDALRKLLGERLTTDDDDRHEHARDVSHHIADAPAAVAFPETTDEVSEIVKICAANQTPVIPFGTGTAVEGGVVAVHGGISVDTSRLNKVIEINPIDMDAKVEAGVTRYQLNRALAEQSPHLHFPIDPGADASLGGMAATCASGSAAVRYGTMSDNVLGLTVVMADGSIIHTGGRAHKSVAGYDLTRLLVGSEGTLGIITEVIVRLARSPEAVASAICPFEDINAAVNSVIEVMATGIPMARIELLDEVQMDAVNRYSNLNYQVAPTLFLEFHGSKSAVTEQSEAVADIIGRNGGGDFHWSTEKKDRDRLWLARYDAYYAALALREGSVGFVTDVCIPISQMAECIRLAKQYLAATKIPATLLGHVGDGNYHVVFAIDRDNPGELDEVRAISKKITDDALKHGGSCTAEHGIGLGKLDALEKEFPEAIETMRIIKRALDPQNIMNPGKVVRAF